MKVPIQLSRIEDVSISMGYLPLTIVSILGGARGVMVIVIGNGHGDTSSNPG